MNAATQSPNYFNLHTSGIGYMNRIRLVPPSKSAGRRGQSFYACSISALRGSSDEAGQTYFDLRVSGKEAIEIVQKLVHDQAANRKIFVSFKVGDIYPHMYERDARDQAGKPTGQKEWACLIKGRLLQINSITIDGEKVYQRDAEAPADTSVDDEGNSSQQPAFSQTPGSREEAASVTDSQEYAPRHVVATPANDEASPEEDGGHDGSFAGLYADYLTSAEA